MTFRQRFCVDGSRRKLKVIHLFWLKKEKTDAKEDTANPKCSGMELAIKCHPFDSGEKSSFIVRKK